MSEVKEAPAPQTFQFNFQNAKGKTQKISITDGVDALQLSEDIQEIDLRFTDTLGKEQHVTVPVGPDMTLEDKMFDGSSIAGWRAIDKSDMMLRPVPSSAVLDPFTDIPTLNIRCDVINPETMLGYDRDPRFVAKKAETYLQTTGIGDKVLFGPEPEFFIFDDVKWHESVNGCGYQVDAEEGIWNSNTEFPGRNTGHRPGLKGGYFPVPPVDSSHNIRAHMTQVLKGLGLVVEAHHHEVATGNQNEIATRFNTLCLKADEIQILKYVVHNVAHQYGKTATFMPKPLIGDNGSGMHCHQSISKDGNNIFNGDLYGGLSQEALYYIGGIIKHAKAINAFCNASTNSYKRLVPGFEAPVLLAYSTNNRSASIRIPHVHSAKARRIEVRFPDCTANPYLAFSAMLMAGLDGIANKINPGEAMDKDLYDLPAEELQDIPTVAGSLAEALQYLEADQEFLLMGDVFTQDMIAAYMDLKWAEVDIIRSTTHPGEFKLYYSV